MGESNANSSNSRRPDNLLSIGEFSKISRASIKSLRYYDEIGIFSPAYVDPVSHYRYYSINQIYDLNLVRLCVEEEVPTEELRSSYSDGDVLQAARFFEDCRKRAEDRWRRDRATMLRMESYSREYEEQITADILSTRVRRIKRLLMLSTPIESLIETPTYSEYLGSLTNCIKQADDLGLIFLARQGVVKDDDGRWNAFVEIHDEGNLDNAAPINNRFSLSLIENRSYRVESVMSSDVNHCFRIALEEDCSSDVSAIQESWAYGSVVGAFIFDRYYKAD
jgi:DNA-binding transcriptional MerR regulator